MFFVEKKIMRFILLTEREKINKKEIEKKKN